MEQTIVGGISGGIAALITSPLELIKTRMQSNASQIHQLPLHHSKSNVITFSIQCAKEIIRKEGMSSLWKGATPTVFGSIPSRAIFFGVYSQAQACFSDLPKSTNTLLSSFMGGIVATTLTSPIWMIKTRMQLNEKAGTVSPISVLKDVIRNEGVKHLWKGIGASWLGVFETCTQWIILEHIKQYHENSFVCAAIAKLLATTLWYPHEVIRTRMREKNNPYKNLFHCLMQISRSESISALYSGLGIQLLRVVPNFALTVYLYDTMLKLLHVS